MSGPVDVSFEPAWRPTIAHLRAAAGGILIAIVAVLIRRPDLLVLATPLLAIAAWSTLTRPTRTPVVDEGLAHATLREGETTAWRVGVRLLELTDAGDDDSGHSHGVEQITVLLGEPQYTEIDPPSGVVTTALQDGTASTEILLRTTRWGRRSIGPARVVATSAWAAFRWSSSGSPSRRLTTLPLPAVFDATAPVAHPVGLVGAHRSTRPGDGSEFLTVRPFQVGDRLRRIHWPRSTRSGTLHVTATAADQDSHVVLLVDAINDIGESAGIDGTSSSLDTAVRAAGAIAEHHLRRGDRVSLHIIGARGLVRVPPASGIHQLRRVLETLAAITPGTDQRDDGPMQLGLSAGSLVVMLSPVSSPIALRRAVTLARRGLTVVVVDTMPSGILRSADDDPFAVLAWRIRLLERRAEIHRVQEAGVPVVAWRGPGSLDQVLRDLHRRAGAPRVGRR